MPKYNWIKCHLSVRFRLRVCKISKQKPVARKFCLDKVIFCSYSDTYSVHSQRLLRVVLLRLLMSCNHVGESVPAGPGSCPALQQVEDQHCHCREGAARPQYQQGQHRNHYYPPQ